MVDIFLTSAFYYYERETDRQTDGQTDRQTDRDRDIERNRVTEKE